MKPQRRRAFPVGFAAFAFFLAAIALVVVTCGPELPIVDGPPPQPVEEETSESADRQPIRGATTAPVQRRERAARDIEALRRDRTNRRIELSGVVVDEDGSWVGTPSALRFEAQDGQGNALDAGGPGTEPTFQMEWSLPVDLGVVRLRAVHEDGRVSAWWSSEVWDPRDDVVHWVVLQLRPSVELHGRTVDADGRPAPGTSVLLATGSLRRLAEMRSRRSERVRVRSNDQGRFRVRVRTWVDVHAAALGENDLPGPLEVAHTQEAGSTTVLSDLVVPGRPVCRWTLRVTDRDGAPLEGVRLRAERHGPSTGLLGIAVPEDDNAPRTDTSGAIRFVSRTDADSTEFVLSRPDLRPQLVVVAPGPGGEIERTIVMDHRPGARVRLVRHDGRPVPSNVVLRVQRAVVPPPLTRFDLRAQSAVSPAHNERPSLVEHQFQYDESRAGGVALQNGVNDVRSFGAETAQVVVYLHHEKTGVRGRPLLAKEIPLEAVREPTEHVIRLPAGRRVELDLPRVTDFGRRSTVDFAVWCPDPFPWPEGVAPTGLEKTVLWRAPTRRPTAIPERLELWVPLDVLELRAGFLEASDRAKTFDGSEAVAGHVPPHTISIPVTGDVRKSVPKRLFDALHPASIGVKHRGRAVYPEGLPITIRRVGSPLDQYVHGQIETRLGEVVLLPPGTYRASIAGGSAGTGSVDFAVGDRGTRGAQIEWKRPGDGDE